MQHVFYCVDPPGVECEGEGEDNSRWFTTKREALAYIKELQAGGRDGWSWYTIRFTKYIVRTDLTKYQLALATLNRKAWAKEIIELGAFDIPELETNDGKDSATD